MFTLELHKLGHKVSVVAPKGSEYPEGVTVFETELGGAEVEQASFPLYSHTLAEYDVIHDLSHLHMPALQNPGLPAINVFWHDPWIRRYLEPNYNVVALSEWGAMRFREAYRQEVVVQETIIVPWEYVPEFPEQPSSPKVVDAQGNPIFLSLGLMLPLKGHLEAMRYCRKLGVGLDVVGGKMPTDDPSYEDTVRKLCTNGLKFWGDVDDGTKIMLMREAEALIYPMGQLEVHSHKFAEALACGCPAITYNKGAMKEVIGEAGYVVDTEEEFLEAMRNVGSFDRSLCVRQAERWRPEIVVTNYIKLYERVANGARWSKLDTSAIGTAI